MAQKSNSSLLFLTKIDFRRIIWDRSYFFTWVCIRQSWLLYGIWNSVLEWTYLIVGEVNKESALIRVSSSNTWSAVDDESLSNDFRRSWNNKKSYCFVKRNFWSLFMPTDLYANYIMKIIKHNSIDSSTLNACDNRWFLQ